MNDAFQIFQPFLKDIKSNSEVIITSWNVSNTIDIRTVIDKLQKTKSIKLIVGFNKETHDLNKLKSTLFYYYQLGWKVKVIPGMHAKVWSNGKDAYVGSCNFFPSTIINYMHKTKMTPRMKTFLNKLWDKGYNINKSSKLWLLPQIKI